MRRADFAYDLPEDLIAQTPPAQRGGSRLLRLDTSGQVVDAQFADFPGVLRPNGLRVLNDTRVIPARVFGAKPTGGQVEILLERILDDRRIIAHVRATKALRAAEPRQRPGGATVTFLGRRAGLFELAMSGERLEYFERCGSMPLPPYIERAAETSDADR